MTRFVLYTAECAQVGGAIEAIIERHRDDIALVVTSDIYGGARGGVLRQTWNNLVGSGPGFVNYLAFSFLYYPLLRRLFGARAGVAEQCRRHGIPHLHSGNVNSAEAVARVRAAAPDFLVVYWFDQILREELIALPARGVVNVHAAYLPRCRGLFPGLYSALENHASDGAQPFGISAHLIEDRAIDAGPILAQRKTEPPPGRSVLYLEAWVNRAGVELVGEVLGGFDRLKAQGAPQAEGSYYSYPDRSQLRELKRQRRALFNWRDYLAVLRKL